MTNWTEDSYLLNAFEDMFGDPEGMLTGKETSWLTSLAAQSIHKVWALSLRLDDDLVIEIFKNDWSWFKKCFLHWRCIKIIGKMLCFYT